MSLKKITDEYKLIGAFDRYRESLNAAKMVLNNFKNAIDALKQDKKYEEIATDSEKANVDSNNAKCMAFLDMTESAPLITCDENQCAPATEVSNG